MTGNRLLTPLFLLCFTTNFAQGMSFNLFLHLPGFLNALGAAEVEIGFLFGLTGLAAVAARPSIGPMMDIRGRRVVIVVGALLNVLVCALYLTVHSIGPWLMAVRLLHGIAESMLFSVLFTYAADIIPAERRTEGLARFGISGILPISLGGVLGDLILARFDYDALFLAATGFGVIAVVLGLRLPERRPAAGDGDRRGFTHSLIQRDLLPIWFGGSVFAIALASVFTFIKRFVDETGVGSVGGFFTAYSGAAVVLRLFLAWLPERVGPKRVLFPAMATLAVGLLLLGEARTATAVLVAGTCAGLGHGLTFPILMGLVVTRARDAERGAAMAVFTALFDLGALVGGPIFGWVVDAVGFGPMFRLAGFVIALGIAGFAAWDRSRG
ncbi:MAG: MFS transporter [Deltaproteobacteria bacterium]|nr:MAG: MFS transporter [Deltaproteobacteria bacterium]